MEELRQTHVEEDGCDCLSGTRSDCLAPLHILRWIDKRCNQGRSKEKEKLVLLAWEDEASGPQGADGGDGDEEERGEGGGGNHI